MKDIIKGCANAYSHFMDEESIFILENRILYSLTKNEAKMHNIITLKKEGAMFSNLLKENKRNYIFGAGAWGREIISTWPGCWQGVIDNNVNLSGKYIDGIKIGVLQDFSSEILKSDARVFICTRLYYEEILKQLIDFGISVERIVNIGKIIDDMAKKQYFDLPIFQSNNHEVFIDVGSFDALTSLNFIDWCNGAYKSIYAFEPDEKNVVRCKETLKYTWGGGKFCYT